jgi:hypothetical protein
MKSVFDRIFTFFNAIIPVAVIVFIISTHKDYVHQDEYNAIKTELFQRLDKVEELIHKLVDAKQEPKISTQSHSK